MTTRRTTTGTPMDIYRRRVRLHELLAGTAEPRVRRGPDAQAGILRGVVLATVGEFRDGRGQFDEAGLRKAADLINKGSPRSRWQHPLFEDGLGRHLGRVRNARLDSIGQKDNRGKWRVALRGDLHISPVSRRAPEGDLGGYVLALAAEDPDVLSMSMVLKPEVETRRSGAPLWTPKVIWAIDVVDTGAATFGLL